MKKTIQSLLTAAVFSAAVTSSLNVSAQESVLAKTALPMAPLYGPPPVDRYLGDIYMDDEIDVRDLSKLKKLLLENDLKVELGEIGDPDRDGRIQIWSWGSSGIRDSSFLGDMNQDGVLDKADVQELIRRLTCQPEDDPDETTTVTEVTSETTSTTLNPETMMVLYGPPRAWN